MSTLLVASRPFPSTGVTHSLLATESSDVSDPHSLSHFPNASTLVVYPPPRLSPLPLQSRRATHDPQPLVLIDIRLPDIDPVSLSLHNALHDFHPLTVDYAETPFPEAFNWAELVLPQEEAREWYCVVFRSRRKLGSDSGPLYDADRVAHQEAIQNGGLIMYWYGEPNPRTRNNLATCIWQSRAHAITANAQPYHRCAVKLAAVSYETYELERWVLRKEKGSAGVTIEPYKEGPVGW